MSYQLNKTYTKLSRGLYRGESVIGDESLPDLIKCSQVCRGRIWGVTYELELMFFAACC